MVMAKYNFRQSELYSVARMVLRQVEEYLADFGALKPKYTAEWVAERLAEVEAAMQLPDREQRSEGHEVLRVRLEDYRDVVLAMYHRVERYVKEGFVGAEVKPMLEAAGKAYHEGVIRYDWESCSAMLHALVGFVRANEARLMEGGNMPGGFVGELEGVCAAYTQGHADFLQAEAVAQLDAERKVVANNAVYEMVRGINADAQAIFSVRERGAVRRQFELTKQLYYVRGAGVAGMRFRVMNGNNAAVADAVITIDGVGKVLRTDVRGRALQLQLSAQPYTVRVEAEGYAVHTGVYEPRVGTVKRVAVVLVAV